MEFSMQGSIDIASNMSHNVIIVRYAFSANRFKNKRQLAINVAHSKRNNNKPSLMTGKTQNNRRLSGENTINAEMRSENAVNNIFCAVERMWKGAPVLLNSVHLF